MLSIMLSLFSESPCAECCYAECHVFIVMLSVLIMNVVARPSITDTQHNSYQHLLLLGRLRLCWVSCFYCYADCHVFIVMLSVLIMNIITRPSINDTHYNSYQHLLLLGRLLLCWVPCFHCYSECPHTDCCCKSQHYTHCDKTQNLLQLCWVL
jgi:hypothetical protein